jgi:hypothetical protein
MYTAYNPYPRYWTRWNPLHFLLRTFQTEYAKLILSQRPPLYSSGQSSWLQIQKSAFDSRRNQIFWEVVGLERGPPSLLSTIEELRERNSSGSGLESWEYGRREPLRWPRGTLHPQKLPLGSPTSGGLSVGIVRSRTHSTEFSFYFGGICRRQLEGQWTCQVRSYHESVKAIFMLLFLTSHSVLVSVGLFYYPEDGGYILLRNVSWLSADYATFIAVKRTLQKTLISEDLTAVLLQTVVLWFVTLHIIAGGRRCLQLHGLILRYPSATVQGITALCCMVDKDIVLQ